MAAAIKWPPNRSISAADLADLALDRLMDGRVLLDADRPVGAVYLAGYALELALKTRICRLLGWDGYPEAASDFPHQLRSFQTHDLRVLLILSGAEADVKAAHFTDWSTVQVWNTEMRYAATRVGVVANPRAFLDAVVRLLPFLI